MVVSNNIGFICVIEKRTSKGKAFYISHGALRQGEHQNAFPFDISRGALRQGEHQNAFPFDISRGALRQGEHQKYIQLAYVLTFQINQLQM
jgi:hypothetical protein